MLNITLCTPLGRRRPYGVVPLILWLALAATARAQGPTRVEVRPVVDRDVAPTIELVGTIGPRLRTNVAAEVAGLVANLGVDIGDRVSAGQPLCKLRDHARRTAHDEAVATRQRLEAVLAERQADLEKAAFEKKRTEELRDKQQCTEKECLDTQADFRIAASRVEQARHDIDAQKAVVAQLADDLARTEIRAPCDGFIVQKLTEIGSWVDRGGQIVELIDLSHVRVRVAVPEACIAFCRPKSPVTVTAEAVGKQYASAISRVIPDADEQARTFPVEIDIDNANGELKAGMFVRVAVPSGPSRRVAVVPKDAVVSRGPTRMIFVVRSTKTGSVAAPVPVKIVAELLDEVAVAAKGLRSGDRVVVRGNEYMFGPGPVIVSRTVGGAASRPVQEAEASARGEPEAAGR